MLPRITERQLGRVPPVADDSPLAGPPPMRYSHSVALSGFTETLRGAKVAMDIALGDKRPKIVGIISVLPYEGKSTVSKNLASLIAHL
ncbi:hypothetical protein J8J27_29985, partial [Mycobacterium tuberculosis]|nr:hypothetical protein [Mycobacterium tuberculosis]